MTPWLNSGTVISRLSPGSGGPLVDPDGSVWTITRRRLDLRVVRGALHGDATVPLLLGENGGFDIRWVRPDERASLWERVRSRYAGRGGVRNGNYMGHEFVNPDGQALVYIEVWC